MDNAQRDLRLVLFVSVIALVTGPMIRPTYGQPVDEVLINLRFTEGQGWLINTWQETKTANPPVLPYLWVACSARGTVVRIATATFDPLTGQTVAVGEILGEYWTAPEGCRVQGNFASGPSRTTVDFDGSVWVANRNDLLNADCDQTSGTCGHVVKIGNGLAFQWIDRNNNGILDTSLGLGDIRPWPEDRIRWRKWSFSVHRCHLDSLTATTTVLPDVRDSHCNGNAIPYRVDGTSWKWYSSRTSWGLLFGVSLSGVTA